MTRIQKSVAAFLCLGLLVLAGCSGPGGGRSGGYYKDDGPGSSIPADIEAIPDATPRVEKHAPANFRPYVVFGKRYFPVSDEKPFRQEGTASWYGRKFHGQKTANGETYDMYGMSAAHPTLPIPSYARVTRAGTGKSVIVRVNDRGPFHSARIIDLSYVAAAKLGLIGPGSGQVVVEAITNQQIRNNDYTRPKAAPIPTAAPPAPPPKLIARVPTAMPVPVPVAVPDALAALQHGSADGPDAPMAPGTEDGIGRAQFAPTTVAFTPVTEQPTSQMAASTGQIFLQFGAFSAQQTADNLAEKLNSELGGLEARPAHVQAARDLYRVQMGPYPSRTAAVNASLRIQQQTGLQPSLALR